MYAMFASRNNGGENVTSVKEGFLSSLALRFPFISSLMGGDTPELKEAWSNNSFNQPPDSGLSLAEQGLSKLSSASNFISEEMENVKPER
jgi:hypothetical protein